MQTKALFLARLAAVSMAVASLVLPACSSRRRDDWKGQKAYGAYMARRGFWREALFRFQKAAELKPDDAEVQNDVAVAYESLGETALALAAYKKAIELAPNDARIKRNYARFAESYTAAQRASSAPAPK
jgi:Flp pilus assembly protein TadD